MVCAACAVCERTDTRCIEQSCDTYRACAFGRRSRRWGSCSSSGLPRDRHREQESGDGRAGLVVEWGESVPFLNRIRCCRRAKTTSCDHSPDINMHFFIKRSTCTQGRSMLGRHKMSGGEVTSNSSANTDLYTLEFWISTSFSSSAGNNNV